MGTAGQVGVEHRQQDRGIDAIVGAAFCRPHRRIDLMPLRPVLLQPRAQALLGGGRIVDPGVSLCQGAELHQRDIIMMHGLSGLLPRTDAAMAGMAPGESQVLPQQANQIVRRWPADGEKAQVRERSNVVAGYDYREIMTSCGTSFGIMALLAGAERGLLPRAGVR